MAVNSLSPAFVILYYVTFWGWHTMTLPTLDYGGGTFTTPGDFDTWNAGAIDADTMVAGLTTVLAPLFHTSVNFNRFEVYTQEDADADPVLAYIKEIDVDGSDADPGWYKAVQLTLSMKTTGGHLARMVMMDAASNDNFDIIQPVSGNANLDALFDVLADPDNGWSSRADEQIAVATKASTTINEALRRLYRMV